MSEKKIYLTFSTDRDTLDFLRMCQEVENKTQPEMINCIIQRYKEFVYKWAKSTKNEEENE